MGGVGNARGCANCPCHSDNTCDDTDLQCSSGIGVCAPPVDTDNECRIGSRGCPCLEDGAGRRACISPSLDCILENNAYVCAEVTPMIDLQTFGSATTGTSDTVIIYVDGSGASLKASLMAYAF